MIDLYVVESPLQALSAAEAKAKNGNDIESVILASLGSATRPAHNEHLTKAVAFGKWNKAIWVDFSKKTGFAYHFAMLLFFYKIKKQYREKVRHLYMGEFRSEWMLYLRCIVFPENTYLLDDGAATLTVQKKYLSKGILWPGGRSRGTLKNKVKCALYHFFYDRRAAQKIIHVFTSFNVVPAPEQIVVKHSFEFVRQNTHSRLTSSEVYHFGAKYSEAGIVALEDEIYFLRKVRDYYNKRDLKMVYIPHRDDSNEKLDLIKKKLGLPVKVLGLPAELYFSISDDRPLRISAAYSSVLNNLRFFLEGEACDSFVLPGSIIKEGFKDNIEEIYDYYNKIGLNLIYLDFNGRRFEPLEIMF